MSNLPESVRIREVGPRDGFQNEPEVIATEDKVRLIDCLSNTGVRRLEVTSFVRQDVIPQLYRRADCWIVSSITEGFGMPGLESAACRCPVVSTRCGGPEDYVHDGSSGYLVPVGDAQEMARRIVDVVTQPDDAWRRMSEASYAVARTFNWPRSAEILEDALIAAVNAHAPAPGPAAAVQG